MSDERIAPAIFELLHDRADGATICPSEVARALEPNNWRPLMPAVREVATELARERRVDVLQRGHVIELNAETRGPVRIGWPRDAKP